jgi:hypothetical protein
MVTGRWLGGSRHRVTFAALFSILFAAASASAQNTFPLSGSVGIGTMSPGLSLDVRGQMRIGDGTSAMLNFGSGGAFGFMSATTADWTWVSPANGNVSFQLSGSGNQLRVRDTGNNDIFGVFQNGRVGIGTSTPQQRLDVIGGLRIGDSSNAVLNFGSGGAFGFMSANSSNWLWASSLNGNVSFQLSGSGNAMTVRDTNSNVVFAALQNGRIGIGTASPAVKFHVAGDAQVDGNLAAKYQDIAEWVPARGNVGPGTVVVIDDQAANGVVPAARAYDTRVAGVVSDRPGLLLGEGSESKVKVAHSGRVKVKVNARLGAIAAGDLLVSSPEPGVAMRSEPINVGGAMIHRPGTLIGKALESLDQGEGEILVLLMLQ